MKDVKLLIEKSQQGQRCFRPAREEQKPSSILPGKYLRKNPAGLPEVGELDLVRHYTILSQKNVAVTTHFYPLGSCTMKYNPEAVLREMARPENAWTHPLQDESECQGVLKMMKEMESMLSEISGLPRISLQPAAGAHGELCALLVIKKALVKRGEDDTRRTILIPDSAHGTNPASCTMAGFKTKTVKSNSDGLVDLKSLESMVGPDTAGIMITNPNTLGLFEKSIAEIAGMIHEADGYVYMDGANLNAILGRARPGDFKVDAMHFNLHKTFATPHGMGGPGAGPIGVTEELGSFLPVPRIVEKEGLLRLDYDSEDSIGSVRGFYGNTAVIAMAWAYIKMIGREGLERISGNAVLNANYILNKVKDFLFVPHAKDCMHEFVASAKPLATETGVNAMDVAKALLDRGFHPPTTYFPLIVPEALMVEPTETESIQTLDLFINALREIVQKSQDTPEEIKGAPRNTPISRPDEVKAVKEPRLHW